MLTLMLLVLGIAFAWLAVDAWLLRGGVRLPYFELLKMRGQSADHLTLEEQNERQRFDERRLTGNTNSAFVVFAVISVGCFLGVVVSWVPG